MEMLNLRLLILLGVLVFGIGIVYGDENECLNGLHYSIIEALTDKVTCAGKTGKHCGYHFYVYVVIQGEHV